MASSRWTTRVAPDATDQGLVLRGITQGLLAGLIFGIIMAVAKGIGHGVVEGAIFAVLMAIFAVGYLFYIRSRIRRNHP